MFVPNVPPQSRKRQRQLLEPTDEHSPALKKQKRIHKANTCRGHRPPSFWDTLSKVRLTGGALREFDRRTISQEQRRCISESKASHPSGSALQRLKRFSRHGGPDLTHLRGFACLPLTMSQSSSRSRKRSTGSGRSDSTKTSGRSGSTKKTSPYNADFEQKLVDEEIYPEGYEFPDGRIQSTAANLDHIQHTLRRPRESLSPSQFSDGAFQKFKRETARAANEPAAMANVMPIIAGRGESSRRVQSDVLFSHLDPLAEGLTAPKPDIYDGARPETIDRRVRAELGRHIVPSTNTTLPAAPNFFTEGKSAQGRADVARRQATYNGAVGARAMHSLQNYRRDQPVYDGNAYTISNTYHDGTLKVYETHPVPPTAPGGRPQYHTNQVRAYAMTDTKERFVEGATAYRNSQELTGEQRRSFIAQANRTARQLPAGTPFSSQTGNRASLSTLQEDDGSDSSSDDEPDGSTTVKRSRPALGKQPARYPQNSQRTSRLTAPSAHQQPVGTPSSSQTGGRTSLTTPVDDESDTSSDDEPDDSTTVKRSRPALGKQPARYPQNLQRMSRLSAPSSRQQPVGTPSSSQTGCHASLTTPVDDDESDSSDGESDSSTDELARNETTPVKRSSRAQGKMPARGSQSSQGTSQAAVQQPTVLSSRRDRVNGRWGYKIEHDDKIKFVPDSLWTPFERNGRKVLYCSSLKVYTFPAQSSGR